MTMEMGAGTVRPPTPVGRELSVDERQDARDYGDMDSALGDMSWSNSLTTSLSISVTNYRWENGRRYHAFDPSSYDLPNDEPELDRLDLQHHIWRMSLNGSLYLSPILPTARHVLDVGTGTGLWAIEFAEEHSDSAVIGTDLSPVQPAFVPPNCRFIIDNAEYDWVFEERFDFIHSRLLFLGMRNWEKYFNQCFYHLQPGGWLETHEMCFPCEINDDSIKPEDSKLVEWSHYMIEAGQAIGMDPTAPSRFRPMLEAQGFVNIRAERLLWPFGPWPQGNKEKRIGAWNLENTDQGLHGASMGLFTRNLGWTSEQVESYVTQIRNEIRDPTKHQYMPIYVYCAQKPPLQQAS